MIRFESGKEITTVIDFPCIITDNKDRILCWYFPEVLDEDAQEAALRGTKLLSKELSRATCKPQDAAKMVPSSWRRDAQYFRPAEDCEIPPGTITLAPVWHESAHPFPKFPPVQGAAWRNFHSSSRHRLWSAEMEPLKGAMIAISFLCFPRQTFHEVKAATKLRKEPAFDEAYVDWEWPSQGLAIICNRQTPLHRDCKTSLGMYDTLATCGKYPDGDFVIEELNVRLRYKPGTIISLAGGLLRHGAEVATGERVAFAGFMRQELWQATDTPIPFLTDLQTLRDDIERWAGELVDSDPAAE
ncbi:hypothetical protein BDW22DRAFT_1363951 [Trametopsis cervina]|nr:hypothetical protein BDW22DRAFT_1363951 [Trametopsis cervina]